MFARSVNIKVFHFWHLLIIQCICKNTTYELKYISLRQIPGMLCVCVAKDHMIIFYHPMTEQTFHSEFRGKVNITGVLYLFCISYLMYQASQTGLTDVKLFVQTFLLLLISTDMFAIFIFSVWWKINFFLVYFTSRQHTNLLSI